MSKRREPQNMNDDQGKRQQWETPDELRAIEAQLGGLSPREDRLDRERLVFLAGKASVDAAERSSSHWAWPTSFAAMTALAATLFVMLLVRPTPSPSDVPPEQETPVDVRRNFAERNPRLKIRDGITTATAYRESELNELLYGNTQLAANGAQPSGAIEEQLHRSMLTPSSWNELFEDSLPIN